MTPQEHQLVDELFDRLTKLENTSRDPDAERLIAEGAKRAPHAVYALVQTVLVQDEALRLANARIEELQAPLSGAEQQQQRQRSFLDSMRDAVSGRREARGSVPVVRPQDARPASAGASGEQWQAGYPPTGAPPQSPYPAGQASGAGGSFLGTAASTAAGVIGGALLLDGIRSMFGHHSGIGGQNLNAFGSVGDTTSPWGGGGAGSDRARDAGLDDISAVGADAGHDRVGDDAGLIDAADEQDDTEDRDLNDNSDFSDGGFDSGDTEDV